MKLYEITIQPTAGFGTPLKGDTLFGHICWQAAYDPGLLEGGLEKQISAYPGKPFAVFSSAFPKLTDPPGYALKRPDVPLSLLFSYDKEDRAEQLKKIKSMKKKEWMRIDGELNPDFSEENFFTDRDISGKTASQITETDKFLIRFPQPHNTVNRLTQSTGPGAFAPYSQEISHYYPGTKLAIFVLIDESATDIERICTALKNVGRWGYGKDASIGMGRFALLGHKALPLPDTAGANACYTLGPCVPDKDCFSSSCFTPFVRFGKHGDRGVLSKNPFKNPVVMADEGAVFKPKQGTEIFKKPYLGQAVTGVSKSMPETVVQGYAPYLPLKMEGLK